MSEITLPLAQYEALLSDATNWRNHLAREEARRVKATAAYYAEGASVAQQEEQPPSKRQVAGSTPVGGAIATRLHKALEGLAGPDKRMTDRAGKCGELAYFGFGGSDGWVGNCAGTLDEEGVCQYQSTHCAEQE